MIICLLVSEGYFTITLSSDFAREASAKVEKLKISIPTDSIPINSIFLIVSLHIFHFYYTKHIIYFNRIIMKFGFSR